MALADKWLAKDEADVNVLADKLNGMLAEWLSNPCETTEGIFAIGRSRGGSGRYNSGGIFWFDFKREGDRLAGVKQIFGHTENRKGPVVTDSFVALDTTNNKTDYWLFDTSVNELVRLDPEWKPTSKNNKPGYICDLPEDEQKPFDDYLTGKSVPFKGGYWPTDYRRWKPAFEDQKIRAAAIWKKLTPDEQARCNEIEYAIAHPKEAGWTPSEDDVLYLHHMKNYPRRRYLPVDEQGPFLEWMLGQGCPFVPGVLREDQDFFYQYDYDRWKRHPNSWEHP